MEWKAGLQVLESTLRKRTINGDRDCEKLAKSGRKDANTSVGNGTNPNYALYCLKIAFCYSFHI